MLYGRHGLFSTSPAACLSPVLPFAISRTTAVRTSFTPLPETAESTSGFLRAADLELRDLGGDGVLVERIALGERDDLLLLGEARAVGLELRAHGAIGAGDVLARGIDEVQQHAAALDMAEEARAEPRALVRALDQARNVGQHEIACRRRAPRRGWDAAW